jgi:hypothetical protein
MHPALTMLIYGSSKAGKSSLAATAPPPRLILDVEAAARFLPVMDIAWDPKDAPPEASKHWDTAVVSVRDWSDAKAAYAWLHSGKHSFKSVIVDSVTELQNRQIEATSGRAQPNQQAWGTTFREVSGFLRDLRDLTFHPTNPLSAVVVTAMAKQVDGMWRPWMAGQSAVLLPYIYDVTGYLWVEPSGEGEVRKLLTRRTPQFEAGERVQGRIPPIITLPVHPEGENGTEIERWIEKIFGSTSTTPTPTPTPTKQPAKQTTTEEE